MDEFIQKRHGDGKEDQSRVSEDDRLNFSIKKKKNLDQSYDERVLPALMNKQKT